jgi:hypothetical protein
MQRHPQIDLGVSQQCILLSNTHSVDADSFPTEKVQAKYLLEDRRTALSLDDLYGGLLELGLRIQW